MVMLLNLNRKKKTGIGIILTLISAGCLQKRTSLLFNTNHII